MNIVIRGKGSDDDEEDKRYKSHWLAPRWPFRILAIGGSEAGKTTACITLVYDYMQSDRFLIYSRYLDTPFYTDFKNQVEDQEDEADMPEDCRSVWESSLEEVIDPGDLNKHQRTVVIFDDMINEKDKAKKIISEYFTAGRHGNASVMCMMHNLKGLSPTGRQSVSQLLLFGGSPPIRSVILKEIHADFITDMDFPDFEKLYKACVSVKHGFLYVDLKAKTIYERYRFRFDGLFNPSKFFKNKK